MSPTNQMVRLPSAAALLVLSGFLSLATAYPYAIPQPTKTVAYRELDVQPWPLATAGPVGVDDILGRRELNTVCGYIGGNPGLPATCSAGSHCVIDANLGVIGCCPDSGSCTQGIYTGCVDSKSGAQTEVNPYVYTCQGSDLCYKNSFAGGYYQYGCGSTTGLATTVAVTASGKSTIELTTLSAPTKTDSESQSTTKPTSSTSNASKTTSKTTSETSTNTKTSSTETSSSESKTASSTETGTGSATNSGTGSATSTTSASAPDTDGNDNGSKNTGAIIGGSISGVAALVALVVLGIWLWKRRKNNQGLDQNQPGSDSNGNIQPLLPPTMREVQDSRPPPPMPMPVARGTINPVYETEEDERVEPFSSQSNAYDYGPPADIGMAVGGDTPHQMDLDEVPLTRDTRELDDFSQGFNSALGRIPEEENRPTTAPVYSPTAPYPGPRGGGGGPLWQQNRGPSWL